MKKYTKIIAIGLLVLCVMAIIFGNSAKSMDVSRERSAEVSKQVQKIVEAKDKQEEDDIHAAVRKLAHFIEFFVLGILLSLFVKELKNLSTRDYFALSPFLSICVAVLDEYIQVFTNRASLIKDVIIDFSGAVTGILLVNIIILIKQNKNSVNKF